jgi:aspartyl-tRNA(Asn)/glutamyl-tRNA(Gln) amidotransferase subunit C
MDKAEINKIAWLARLKIEESDIESYHHDMESILGLVEKMNQADTANLAPLSHPLEIKARLRDDQVTETNERDKFQAIAPATEDGLYLVPKVIE